MTDHTPTPGTISHGTLNPVHLVGPLSFELNRLDPESYREWLDQNDPPAPRMTDEEAEDILWESIIDLMDRLDTLAPEGHYFGAHPGDGSDFGFWQVEDPPWSV